jgi:hypothetical protein
LNEFAPPGQLKRYVASRAAMANRKQQVYAIVRIDRFDSGGAPEDAVTVKEIVLSLDAAEKEVTRLNALNGPKGAKYFWQATRIIADDAAGGAT